MREDLHYGNWQMLELKAFLWGGGDYCKHVPAWVDP